MTNLSITFNTALMDCNGVHFFFLNCALKLTFFPWPYTDRIRIIPSISNIYTYIYFYPISNNVVYQVFWVFLFFLFRFVFVFFLAGDIKAYFDDIWIFILIKITRYNSLMYIAGKHLVIFGAYFFIHSWNIVRMVKKDNYNIHTDTYVHLLIINTKLVYIKYKHNY